MINTNRKGTMHKNAISANCVKEALNTSGRYEYVSDTNAHHGAEHMADQQLAVLPTANA
jgi:hypothetical protein